MAASYSPFWKRLSKSGGSAMPASTPRRLSISTNTGPIAGPDAPKPMILTLSLLPWPSAQNPSPSFLNPVAASRLSPFFGKNSLVSYFANRSLTALKYGNSGGYGGNGNFEGVLAPR